MIQQPHFWVPIQKNWKPAHREVSFSPMFTATRLSTAKAWEKPRHRQMQSIHTQGCRSALERKDTRRCYSMEEPGRSHAKWHRPVTKTPTVRSHLQETVFKVVKLIETESRVGEAKGWEGEMGSCCLMGVEFQFCKKKKKVPEARFTKLWLYLPPLSSMLKDGYNGKFLC